MCAHNGTNLSCPNHSLLSVSCIAPDTAFLDLNADYIIPSETIKRGKMIGRGAFGFVFKATIKKPVKFLYFKLGILTQIFIS